MSRTDIGAETIRLGIMSGAISTKLDRREHPCGYEVHSDFARPTLGRPKLAVIAREAARKITSSSRLGDAIMDFIVRVEAEKTDQSVATFLEAMGSAEKQWGLPEGIGTGFAALHIFTVHRLLP